LNYALSATAAGGKVTIADGGVFGPIVIDKSVTITGNDQRTAQIAANPSAQVGCIGALPSGCGLTNNGFAVEVAAGPTDIVKIDHMLLSAGLNGAGALKFTSGGQLQLAGSVFRGNDTATGPIVALNPSNPGTTQAQVYFSYSDVGFNNVSNLFAGGVEVKPSGNTSMKLHFNHVEVHNTAYGLRTDSSLLSSPAVVVAAFVSESEFFSFPNSALSAFSTSGTGTMNAVFNAVTVLNASVAVKSNGPLSYVVLTNSTLVGNSLGVELLNGGTLLTPGHNTVYGNSTNVSGSMTSGTLR
jgi:hypothetical protein